MQSLKAAGLLDDTEYKQLYVHTSIIPYFYGLIKTHKEDYPIWPIVFFIDSPTYQLWKFLSKILLPLTELANVKLKNTHEAKDFLQEQNIPSDHSLVSFDVKSLFTCIPQDYALESVKLLVESNKNLFNQQTKLNKNDILELLETCLKLSHFKWNNGIINKSREHLWDLQCLLYWQK